MAEPAMATTWLRRAAWVSLTLVLGGGSYAIGRAGGGMRALPTIVATLPGDESGFSRELDDRFRTRFPPGSSEDALVDYLMSEDFSPDWRRRDGPNASFFVASGLICTKTIRVLWRADAAGALSDVRASYQSQCL